MDLPEALYTAAQVRELDRLAIEACKIPGATLMQRAGEAAFDLLRARWPRARKIVVLCGPGNNGGDGFVIAHLARAAGLTVTALELSAPENMKGEAVAARKKAKSTGVVIRNFQVD
ncbi:MAG: bifunctional ADP-dependent NAD(P)H-hydrate dehydratase/NAD(P)H-hydrate epimerase, partial [Gammaproteobacteria bacterium]|nr:bifunctional ADP-dependent NAD(P)H-hydrate dehydratase/NAD(P)H-hydrate epimerase [Gammaproteobacteria bacterium]